jgi:hypothetical protein
VAFPQPARAKALQPDGPGTARRAPSPRWRQGTGPTQGADVSMALIRRLAEGAAAAGDLGAAAEAVRVCLEEAENLYQRP